MVFRQVTAYIPLQVLTVQVNVRFSNDNTICVRRRSLGKVYRNIYSYIIIIYTQYSCMVYVYTHCRRRFPTRTNVPQNRRTLTRPGPARYIIIIILCNIGTPYVGTSKRRISHKHIIIIIIIMHIGIIYMRVYYGVCLFATLLHYYR